MRNIVCGVLLLVASCGGDDGADSADRKQLAMQQCEVLKSSVCSKFMECAGQQAGTLTECKQALAVGLDCGAAVAVSSTYNRCITELGQAVCSVFWANGKINYPASCTGAILK